MGLLPHGRNIPPWETLPCWAPTAHSEQERRCLRALYRGDDIHVYTWRHTGGVEETLVFFPCL